MALSALPLSYCTNVHPGRSLDEVLRAIDGPVAAVARSFGRPLAAGLWLAKPALDQLRADPDGPRRLAERLAAHGLSCHTLNAFPFGDFHGPRVKDAVYLPDWTAPERLAYTVGCAEMLARLLPDGGEGSISTLPLGFKGHRRPPEFLDRCADRLTDCAEALARLRAETGRVIRLAVEPEPLCVLETTGETAAFFGLLWDRAGARGAADAVREHVGVCFDICHQAVEFEDVAGAVRGLAAAGVRVNKVHLSCAVRLERPMDDPAGRAALRHYAEPRYLHQTFGRLPGGRVVARPDLTPEFCDDPGPDFAAAEEWRVHFHVPIDVERLGPLATTKPAAREALAAVAALGHAPHLEVETYTWAVLPGAAPTDLTEGMARELAAAQAMIADLR